MPVESISDMAVWMAYARSIESDRPDALFQDHLARRLAGEAGAAIARDIGQAELIARSIAVRTAVLDQLIVQTVREREVDLVVNLAAGLDTRPWRLDLPARLRWLDVDLPPVLQYKATVVGSESANCAYEAQAANVAEPGERARILSGCRAARRAIVLTEGFLVYLRPEQVTALARDLHRESPFQWWLTDLTGPRALDMLRRVWAPRLRGVQFHFGPRDSVAFFQQVGWREVLFRSSYEEAKRLDRATPMPLLSRVLLRLASASFREEFRRMAGVVLLARDPARA
jgi:methyltransferase (TIGR00027 family)